MERKDRDEAIAPFEAMLRIADDADVRNEASVAELNELDAGFLKLSRALLPKPQPVAAPVAAAAAPRPSVIVPPAVIRQRLPPWVPDPLQSVDRIPRRRPGADFCRRKGRSRPSCGCH